MSSTHSIATCGENVGSENPEQLNVKDHMHPMFWKLAYQLQVLWMFNVVWNCTSAVVDLPSSPAPPCGALAANGTLSAH